MKNDKFIAVTLAVGLSLLPLLPLNIWSWGVLTREELLNPIWFGRLILMLAVGALLARMGSRSPSQGRRVLILAIAFCLSVICNVMNYWGIKTYTITFYSAAFEAYVLQATYIVLAILMYRAAMRPVASAVDPKSAP